ncbi:MAG: outer membrane beta-barrel protein [Chloroflexota bacterium]
MRALFRATAVVALVLAAFSPRAASAQGHPQTREGFWFNGGLGYGSLGCQDCGGREGGLSGGIAIGGTVSPKFLLGAGTNGWTKSENGARLSVATLTAMMRFYPSVTGGFFLLGGLGLGTVRAEVSGLGSASETGVGALVGLGYDIRVGQNVSLTPYWNGFAMSSTNNDANIGQLGLGVTVH